MILMQNEYIILEHHPARSLLRVARTKRPYPLSDETTEIVEQLSGLFDSLRREEQRLLIDMREAPLRNDEGFESFATPSLRSIFSGFARTAILVRTAVGELQFSRLKREGKVSAPNSPVFRDETAALAYLEAA